MKSKFREKLLKFTVGAILTLSFVLPNFTITQAQTLTPADRARIEAQIAEQQALLQSSAYNGAVAAAQQRGAAEAISAANTCIASIIGSLAANSISKGLSSLSSQIDPSVTIYVPVYNPVISAKETGNIYTPSMDSIGFCLINGLIRQMSDSIVNWINNGFQNPDGTFGPSFVTNPQEFFLGIADREAGNFLASISGGLLCSDFDLEIRLALLQGYRRSYYNSAQCTLSDTINGFKSGNFFDGGWDSWFQLTQRRQNNWMGSYLDAEDELYARMSVQQGYAQMELGFGSGFLSMKKCISEQAVPANAPAGATGKCDKYEITTPGKVIEDQLNGSLDSGRERLLIADEFDEIISALLDQLLIQVFTGGEGLRGYGSN